METRTQEENGGGQPLRSSWRNRLGGAIAVVAVDQTTGLIRHNRYTAMNRLFDFILAVSAMFVLSAGIVYLLPASLWFEVRSTQVLDSHVGTAPRMIVDRTIVRPFAGDWVVTVLKVVDGGFESTCTATGSADYDPSNVYPTDMNLDWWTWPTQCNLQIGEYVVRTVWTVHVFDRFEKTVRTVSNLFQIAPEGTQNGEGYTQGSAGNPNVQ